MADTSQLTEKIDPSLVDREGPVSVLVVENENVLHSYEIATEIKNPYIFDTASFMPNTKPMTLTYFFEIASDLIEHAQSYDGISEEKKIKLVDQYPPDTFDDFGDEVIAYRLLKREPANMNRKGSARPQRKSMHSHTAMTAEYPNKTIVIESRPIDHVIEFNCWAKSNKLANDRALWLEKLFVTNSWAFEVQGCERFYWKGRGPDTYMTTGGQRLFYRPINFFVRFREFEVRAHPNIKQVLIEMTTRK